MKKNVILKFLVLVLMVAVIFGVAKSSFAVSTITPIENGNTGANNTAGNNTANNVTVAPVNTAPANTAPANNVANNAPTNTAPANNAVVNNSPVNNTVIPATGAKSAAGLFILMGVFGVSAVYTFVRLKKYEI